MVFLLAFGALCAVSAPRKAVSLTIQSYDEAKITNPTSVEESPNPARYTAITESFALRTKAKKLVGKWGGPCVTFARNFTGATPDVVGGMARLVPISTTTPEIGAIVKTNESSFGHLAVVIGMDDENLTVVESNYHWNDIIGIRQISLTDPKILGYIIINN